MKATTIQWENKRVERVDSPTKGVHRSRTWVINQTVERFLRYEEWFIREVENGTNKAEVGKIDPYEEVV